jgi:heme exporter protein CcmD
MSHAAYIALSYGVTALFAGALTLWILFDHRAQAKRLAEMHARMPGDEE